MAQLRGRVGSFLTRKMQPQSIRQRHFNAPQGNGRQTFRIPRRYHQMCLRISAMPSYAPGYDNKQPATWHRHLEGDVQRPMAEEWARGERCDGVRGMWEKRGRLHLHLLDKRRTYVCQRCGYPIRTKLVAVIDDNWDYQICYTCYSAVLREGSEEYFF